MINNIIFIVIRTYNPYNSTGQIDKFVAAFDSKETAEECIKSKVHLDKEEGVSTVFRVRETIVR